MDPQFASDNAAGAHPDVLTAVCNANEGYALAYGNDEYTERAAVKVQKHFGNNAEVYFVYNGTAANVLGISACIRPFNAVICTEISHMNKHECGAPEHFSGCKLITVPEKQGKMDTQMISEHIEGLEDEHYVQPLLISVTQATETGTVYRPEEIKEIASYAHKRGMYVHVDGARIANAAAFLELSMAECVKGADIISLGATKNGLMFGEAVVILNTGLNKQFRYIRKQGMQLHSKMRYIAAQFNAYLSDSLWLRNAEHANRMASMLAHKLGDIPETDIVYPVETNGVFVSLPSQTIPRLQKRFFVHVWDEHRSAVRIMTAFNTREKDIESLVSAIKDCVYPG